MYNETVAQALLSLLPPSSLSSVCNMSQNGSQLAQLDSDIAERVDSAQRVASAARDSASLALNLVPMRTAWKPACLTRWSGVFSHTCLCVSDGPVGTEAVGGRQSPAEHQLCHFTRQSVDQQDS